MEDAEFIVRIAEILGWEERGGGPEGIYWTHSSHDGEYMRHQMLSIIKDEIDSKSKMICM